MLVALLLVLFLLLVFIMVSLATLSGNAMTITDPACSHNSWQVHPPATAAAESLPIPNNPPLPRSLSVRGTPQSPGSNFSFCPYELSRVFSTGNGPAEPIQDKGGDNDCIITNYIPHAKECTIVTISNSKGLKATMTTPLVKKLAQGHMGILQQKLLLSKDPFT